MDVTITICVLTFGDHLNLLQRCLQSIEMARPPSNTVTGFRIVLNACSEQVRNWAAGWCHGMRQRGIPSLIYETTENQFKYPLMRRVIREPRIDTSHVMWFDDDSYLEHHLDSNAWWNAVATSAASHDMIGQHWLMPLQGNQWEWVKTQPWFSQGVGLPKMARVRGKPAPAFKFCQGAWWVAKTQVLLDLNWPIPELRHNGGDSMLGEALRHGGYRMGRFASGVRINADDRGRHSKSSRRGHRENRVGWDYAGTPLDRETHHRFELDYKEF